MIPIQQAKDLIYENHSYPGRTMRVLSVYDVYKTLLVSYAVGDALIVDGKVDTDPVDYYFAIYDDGAEAYHRQNDDTDTFIDLLRTAKKDGVEQHIESAINVVWHEINRVVEKMTQKRQRQLAEVGIWFRQLESADD